MDTAAAVESAGGVAALDADTLRELIAEHVYRDVVSRWRQWNEVF